jgi:hypothetical protein
MIKSRIPATFVALLWFGLCHSTMAANNVAIESVQLDYENWAFNITGSGFDRKDDTSVTLGLTGPALYLVSVTDSQIVASFPAEISEGAYRINVTSGRGGHASDHMDVSIPRSGSRWEVNCEVGNGTWVLDHCWILGSVHQNCDQTCIGVDRLYDDATRTIAGSDGSSANCSQVITAVRESSQQSLPGEMEIADLCTEGYGCAYDDVEGNPFWCQAPETTNSFYWECTSCRLFCACVSELRLKF